MSLEQRDNLAQWTEDYGPKKFNHIPGNSFNIALLRAGSLLFPLSIYINSSVLLLIETINSDQRLKNNNFLPQPSSTDTVLQGCLN